MNTIPSSGTLRCSFFYGQGVTWAGLPSNWGSSVMCRCMSRPKVIVRRASRSWWSGEPCRCGSRSEGLGKLMDRKTERPYSGALGGAAESSTAPAPIQGDMFRAGPVGEKALVREQATAPGEMADEAGGPSRYG